MSYNHINIVETHLPFVCHYKGKIILNPGSVGQPRDRNPKASFLTLYFSSSIPEVKIHRLTYNIVKTINKVKGEKLPSFLSERLLIGR